MIFKLSFMFLVFALNWQFQITIVGDEVEQGNNTICSKIIHIQFMYQIFEW